jgi:phosphate transport system permease protein
VSTADPAIGRAPQGDRVKGTLFRLALLSSLALGLITLIALLADVVIEAAPRLNGDLLTNFPSGIPDNAGAQSAIFGTIWVIGLTALMCIPVGVGAAIYLEEYADGRSCPERSPGSPLGRSSPSHGRSAKPRRSFCSAP